MEAFLEENDPPISFFLLAFLSLSLGTKESFHSTQKILWQWLKYNKSLNNQKNKVLQSKFQEKLIKHQCLINLLCTGFQKWAALEC